MGDIWKWNKRIVGAGAAVALGILLFQGWSFLTDFRAHQGAVQKAQMRAQRQYLKLAENMVRSQTEVVESAAVMKRFADLNNARYEELRRIMEKNDEKLSNVGRVTSRLNDNVRELRVGSDHAYKAGTGDPNEQYFKKLYYKGIAIGWLIYYPNRPEGKRWKYGFYPLEYVVKVIQAEQRDGQTNTYVEAWMENNKDDASEGKQVPIEITESKFVQKRIEKETFHWWAPHLSLHLDAGTNTGAGLGVSLAGYGRTENDLRWKFVEFGAGTDGEHWWGKFNPVSYNLGRHIPLISHTFIGPFIGINNEQQYTVGLSLSVPF